MESFCVGVLCTRAMCNSNFDVWEKDMPVMGPVLGAGSLRSHCIRNTVWDCTCLYLRAGVLVLGAVWHISLCPTEV